MVRNMRLLSEIPVPKSGEQRPSPPPMHQSPSFPWVSRSRSNPRGLLRRLMANDDSVVATRCFRRKIYGQESLSLGVFFDFSGVASFKDSKKCFFWGGRGGGFFIVLFVLSCYFLKSVKGHDFEEAASQN